MNLIKHSSVLLGAVALASMGGRASAQRPPGIEDVLAMIKEGQVQGSGQPGQVQGSGQPEPQEYVPSEEITNYSDVIVPTKKPTLAPPPVPPPMPVTCIDRSLEVCHAYRSLMYQFLYSALASPLRA
jgi:hypothetical protein